MTHTLPQLDNAEYTVGWITALPHERIAAEVMLDRRHAPPQYIHPHDHNTYTLGSIAGPNGNHNIVIFSFPPDWYGTTPAALYATQMLLSFPSIKFGLMVGIGGGIPSERIDIRLGDVAVSRPEGIYGGVRQYDRGERTASGFEECGALSPPPRILLNAMVALQSKHMITGSATPNILAAVYEANPLMVRPSKGYSYAYPGTKYDRLFCSSYEHPPGRDDCTACGGTYEVKRPERPDNAPSIHHGTIASGNMVIKDARTRDLLAKNCICYEMEAAGLMNTIPSLVIRGICDYSDSHKNDRWQNYAAIVAAAYAKELLQITGCYNAPRLDARHVMSSSPSSLAASSLATTINVDTMMSRTMFADLKLDKFSRKIIDWLNPPDPSTNSHNSKAVRNSETGISFLKSKVFQEWKFGVCRHLWLHAKAGSGKTGLASTIIEQLLLERSPFHVALYFFFNFHNTGMRTLEDFICSLVAQIYCQCESSRKELDELWEKCGNGSYGPGLKKLLGTFQLMVRHLESVRVVIDGLDECQSRRELLLWIREVALSEAINLQFLITSRKKEDI